MCKICRLTIILDIDCVKKAIQLEKIEWWVIIGCNKNV